ncbi:MAG: SDR family oxidoreductase [Bacteroidota bacterium]
MMPNKVAIITAASKGMGLVCARELYTRGYKLGLLARSESINEVAKELSAIAVQGSVTSKEDLKRLVDAMMGAHGRIDVVVNNTGHPAKGELLDLSEEDWHKGLDLVLMNVIKLAKLVTPIMQKQRSGAIVNISTFAAFEPSLSFPISSALRAALGGFTKMFADRYAADGIRMNNVLPGFIDSYEINEQIKETIPMHRSGTVQEIAQTVAFLSLQEASYITGQNIKVDGGLTRSV